MELAADWLDQADRARRLARYVTDETVAAELTRLADDYMEKARVLAAAADGVRRANAALSTPSGAPRAA